MLYWFLGNVNPQHAAWLGLVLAVATPWLVASSLRFNLGNTSYRNLRFRFTGGMGVAARVFWPFFVFAVLTIIFPLEFDGLSWGREQWKGLIPSLVLLLFYPWFVAAYRLMLLNHVAYGSALFSTRARIRQVYWTYLKAGLWALALAVPATIISGLLAVAMRSNNDPTLYMRWTGQIMLLLTFLPWALAALLLYAYTQSRVTNTIIGASRLTIPPTPPAVAGNEVRLSSTLRMRTLAKLHVLNLLGIALTAGLAIPWAAVRSARVRAEATALSTLGTLDDVLAANAESRGAAADAASEFFSLDIAL